MSARKLNLRSPAVVAVVAILLVAVAAVNLRTFGSQGRRHREAVERVQAQPSLPSDLSDLVRSAGVRQKATAQAAPAQAGLSPAFVRDPFAGAEQGSANKAALVAAAVPGRRPRPAGKTLVCSAVLLGGPQPAALIGGKAYTPGQRVGGYEVQDVTLLGATLKGQDGGTVFLKVMDKPAGAGSFQVTGGDAGEGAVGPADGGLEERMP